MLANKVRPWIVGTAVVLFGACWAQRRPTEWRTSQLGVGAIPVASDDTLRGQVALGRDLFSDERLSRDSSVSCETCHSPSHAFAEPRTISHGIGERARKRNTPSLINVHLLRHHDWDGRARGLTEQLHGVFSVTGDMGIDLGEAVERVRANRAYSDRFLRFYGRRADMASFVSALVVFQESLSAGGSRFDQFFFGGDSTALSDSERRGWAVFTSHQSGCAGCHLPTQLDAHGRLISLFTDSRFHNLGVGYSNGRMSDVGRFGVTRERSHWGSFRTPPLRNVALTAPYMHDGSLRTLEEVVGFYLRGGIRNPNLDGVMNPRTISAVDSADLVAFLGTLTTEWLTDSGAVRAWLSRGRHTPLRLQRSRHAVSSGRD